MLTPLPCAALTDLWRVGSGSLSARKIITLWKDSLAELNYYEVRGERGRGIIEGSELPLLIQAAVSLT